MENQPGPALIRVLRPELADLIAAGEVVERPASVVKELCENAIDAGATKIEVTVKEGGRRLIQVVDNGSGMTAEDARLALRRHATSKLTAAEQLWGIATLGFRGEALPSIAAVSRLSLTTKPASVAAGVQLDVVGGHEKGFQEVGVPQGTRVEIRDLFFNTPARLKFLKSDVTEIASATETVLRLAIGHPEVHFRLAVDGRQAFDLPVHRSRGERVRAALARRGASVLHEVLVGDGPYTFNLFLAPPEESTTSSAATFLFVGRRYVRDRFLLRAVVEGCAAALEKGRYPSPVPDASPRDVGDERGAADPLPRPAAHDGEPARDAGRRDAHDPKDHAAQGSARHVGDLPASRSELPAEGDRPSHLRCSRG